MRPGKAREMAHGHRRGLPGRMMPKLLPQMSAETTFPANGVCALRGAGAWAAGGVYGGGAPGPYGRP
jgi:hypothetical protein